jgi:hypothetical protein
MAMTSSIFVPVCQGHARKHALVRVPHLGIRQPRKNLAVRRESGYKLCVYVRVAPPCLLRLHLKLTIPVSLAIYPQA